jgi:hypothetical protein
VLRRMASALVLLIAMALVGGGLAQEGEPRATPTAPAIDQPTSTPVTSTANILGPTSTPCDDCPEEGQPPATDTPAPALPPAPIPGHPAPDFALRDLADNELRLADFQGQVVLVNFWATW